ncbi:hypothetical protein AB4Y45_33735 [Paraburkholderia sp. EG287A]|uniref:hypothetical protein n=1 Tax=Paraburkholderia sp. EG287A TaxID=3237012 RepID=UPI0034D1554E
MLTLKNMQMKAAESAHEDDVATLSYDVEHDAFGTTVTLPLTITLPVRQPIREPKVTASLVVANAEGETIEAALNKLATWCERSAAGIRESARKEKADLPLFTRLTFEYETLLPWQKTLYDKLVADLKHMANEGEQRDYLRQQREQHNPIMYLHDAADCARAEADRERDEA